MGDAIFYGVSLIDNSDYNWMAAFNNQEFIDEVFTNGQPYTGYEEEILDYSYYKNNSIGYASFPSCYKRIGSHAFDSCKNLVQISLTSNRYDIDSNNRIICQELAEEAFINCKKLSYFAISTHRKIGSKAFYNCYKLSVVNFPYSMVGAPYESYWMTKIGDEAFANCSSLSSIGGLSYIEKIGKRAFENCISLKSNGYNLGYYICFGIDDYAFNNCTGLLSVNFNYSFNTFPSSVNMILGSHIFENCTSLSYIELYGHFNIQSDTFGDLKNALKFLSIGVPYNASYYLYDWSLSTYIGSHAFENYSLLSGVYISVVDVIDEYAFAGCTSLSMASIGYSICEKISDYAFYNCSNISRIYINNFRFYFNWFDTKSNRLKFGNHVFDGCINLSEIILYGCESIPSYFFSTNINLSYVQFDVPFSLVNGFGYKFSVNIGEYAFYNLKLLSNVNGNVINKIGSHAFENCSIHNNFTVGGYLCNEIGEYAFNSTYVSYLSFNMSYSSIISGSSVYLSVGSHAFENCFNLIALRLGNICYIGESFIYNCQSLQTLTLNYSSMTSKVDEHVMSNIRALSIKHLDISGISIISSNMFANMSYLEAIGLSDAEYIDDDAFKNCTGLEYAYLYKCSIITSSMFRDCSILSYLLLGNCSIIESFTFQNYSKITELDGGGRISSYPMVIGEYAFADCLSLKYVINATINTIGSHAFENCASLSYYACYNGMTESIYEYAFYNCSMISAFTDGFRSLNYIGSHAFENCVSLSLIQLTMISSVPYLESIDAFNNILSDYVINVSSGMYQNFINNSVWGLLSDHISITT